MNALIACEYSGVVRDQFTKMGWDATSCDYLPSETAGKHYQGDVLDILHSKKWDIVIAHPPCTYLCNSGVRWLYNPDGTVNHVREKNMREAANFFKVFLNYSGPIAIENPIMHKHAVNIIGCRPSQYIQPYHFGHGETKKTGLWLKYLPPLQFTNVVDGREQRIWKLPPGEDRWKERSRTFPGIAEAMATQWTEYLLSVKRKAA